jgi:hypothetical protein
MGPSSVEKKRQRETESESFESLESQTVYKNQTVLQSQTVWTYLEKFGAFGCFELF